MSFSEGLTSPGSTLTLRAMQGSDERDFLAEVLRGAPGVLLVAAFGNALHVSGTDAALLERSTERFRADPALRWRQDEPSLEDVFILNMQQAAEFRP